MPVIDLAASPECVSLVLGTGGVFLHQTRGLADRLALVRPMCAWTASSDFLPAHSSADKLPPGLLSDGAVHQRRPDGVLEEGLEGLGRAVDRIGGVIEPEARGRAGP